MQNQLWQCPLKVGRGSYEQMPSDWLGAVVNFYVGAATYEEALTKAVQVVRSMGMSFIDLVGGRVLQLDPERWWDGHVMASYPEFRDHFPTQAQVLGVVRDGLIFHGPFAGWDRE
jgi:hypothetical protein